MTSDRRWILVRRRPMTEQAMYCRVVVATTARLLRRPLHPHAFRHAAATSTAELDPELLGIPSLPPSRPHLPRRAAPGAGDPRPAPPGPGLAGVPPPPLRLQPHAHRPAR